MIPVNETNNLETLFNNDKLKIHYYCDEYVLATAGVFNFEGIVVLDDNAFTNSASYAVVYCDNHYKNEYLTKTSKSGKKLYSGENFLIMQIPSGDFMPANNDGMVIITDVEARLPQATVEYPLVTEQDKNVLGFLEQVSTEKLMGYIQTLQDFETRFCAHPNAVAAQNWITEQYESFGLEVFVQDFTLPPTFQYDSSSDNVIAIQRGTDFPDEYVVCGAHYDSFTFESIDNAPGADDNASGTAGILETARILSQYDFKRSIIYCSFSAEERGLIGSSYYAQQCAEQDINIVGYFNLDMTGYLTPGNEIHIDLIYPSTAQTLANYYINICDVYFPDVPLREFSSLPGGNSDHTSFNNNGFMGVWSFEDVNEISPYIHRIPGINPDTQFEYLGDIIGPSVNNPAQVTLFTKANLACVATLSIPDIKPITQKNIIYPNPAEDKIIINGDFIGQYAAIFDINGKLVANKLINSNIFEIDISNLTGGMYVVKISNKVIGKFAKK